jgi:hypothetical protein
LTVELELKLGRGEINMADALANVPGDAIDAAGRSQLSSP